MIDLGHALMAYEDVAESAALLQYFGQKLFYMHFNDNWRLWDDDMTAGSVHTIELFELLYWLDRVHYTGWYALDIFPIEKTDASRYREHQVDPGIARPADKVGRDVIAGVIASGDAMAGSQMLREAWLDKGPLPGTGS